MSSTNSRSEGTGNDMNVKGNHILVTGAGGFIGGHLVKKLLSLGAGSVRAADIKPLDEWYRRNIEAENLALDLSDRNTCRSVPSIRLEDGLRRTYNWIEQEMLQSTNRVTDVALRNTYATA